MHYNQDWHNADCEARSTSKSYFDPATGLIHFFCTTHGQWAFIAPGSEVRTFTYDGFQVSTRVQG